MLFMLESKARRSASRHQLIRHFSGGASPLAQDLIRRGIVTNVLYKSTNDVGFFALLSAPTPEEACRIVDLATANDHLFDVRIVPVSESPALGHIASAVTTAEQSTPLSRGVAAL